MTTKENCIKEGGYRRNQQSEKMLRALLEFFMMRGSSIGKVPKTKLFKLVYLADYASFYLTGKSISEQQYRNRQYGPVPNALFAIVDEMKENGDIEIENGTRAEFHKLTVEPQYSSLLTKSQIDMLENIARYWRGQSTAVIVQFVHRQRPWSLTKADDVIPYELILQEPHPYKPIR